ncbi:MAG TPA: hypothetical protein VFQ22_01800 [Longimicrobiales bacterium]|nr:hypothetical protein [Longimicrobiales bacterium]
MSLLRRPPEVVTPVSFIRVAMRLRARIEEALEPLDLSYPMYRMLEQVAQSGSMPAPAGSDAERDTLRLLEREGLVRRPGGPLRGWIEVTGEGAARLREAGRRLELLFAEFEEASEHGDGIDRALRKLGRSIQLSPTDEDDFAYVAGLSRPSEVRT